MDETPAQDHDAQLDLNLGQASIELQDDLEGDTLREECGVFGVFGHTEAAAIAALGLHPCSIADRKQPELCPTTEPGSIPSGGWAWSATPSPAAR